ncbi:DNA glycosylase AlkZ-like family protein [Zooshikella ganghwensis]|uniref:Winged helix-turn-helix domain-containing protein n=1 Tax=Zooshikella ganghwensis TaxID=202772 RepID=A0A4V1IMS5_9GAMM|nr:crosslink repair DNA glycosylase YcaQ family protein [Zooshikella ganghwensis]RDH41251.1 hypothetical protein B9G39_29525 [Zooshikella ganghwensis]
MTDSLSIKQAKKIVLLSQVMPHKSTEQATLAAVEQLGYVQIDTIARVEHAHHHTLWNRVKGYQPELLDRLQRKREIFEHWYHTAAYRPIIQNVSLVSWSCGAYNEVAFSIRDVHESLGNMMRDPQRIKQVLELINQIWMNSPDLRFNQLIYNLQYDYSQ